MGKQVIHIKADEIEPIDLGSTKIWEYARLDNRLGLARFSVNGRRPSNDKKVFVESECSFSLLVLKGNGVISIKEKEFKLEKYDYVAVPANTPWFIEGELEYVVATSPGFYPEQSKEIDKDSI